jgi:hypothetical protein
MKTQCMSCGGSMSKGGKTPVKTMKKGGATKNAKLAAVAHPKNKITRADVLTRILKKKKK